MDVATWSRIEAERFLRPLDRRWVHTVGVVHRARALASTAPVADRPILSAAAYVPDVGYAPELEVTGFHPVDGARWLRARGRERLACLVAHHSGARFEAEARGILDTLAEFPEEHSVVADLLTYCDLTTDPEGHEVTFS